MKPTPNLPFNSFILALGALFMAVPFAASFAKEAAVEEDASRVDAAYLHEEEKLARDVYLSLAKQWDLKIFGHIAEAEQVHMDAVAQLRVRQGAAVPVVSDEVGVFSNERLGKLYSTLVKQGAVSEVAALKVGAAIEDMDIKDLRDMRQRTQDRGALQVYARLEEGSSKHMRAFHRKLDERNASYQAQYLTQSELQEVLSGEAVITGERGGCGHEQAAAPHRGQRAAKGLKAGAGPGQGHGKRGKGLGLGQKDNADKDCDCHGSD